MRGVNAGYHLIMDAVVVPSMADKLNDPVFLDSFFRDLIPVLKMEILEEPRFKVVPFIPGNLESDSDEGGVTGTCLITTSHVSIHTWPLRRKFSMDVFSCKEFSRQEAEEFICKSLGVSQKWVHWVERNWPG
jgi:S-adenosylmethionine/arginine decarboxylase-like enzyme